MLFSTQELLAIASELPANEQIIEGDTLAICEYAEKALIQTKGQLTSETLNTLSTPLVALANIAQNEALLDDTLYEIADKKCSVFVKLILKIKLIQWVLAEESPAKYDLQDNLQQNRYDLITVLLDEGFCLGIETNAHSQHQKNEGYLTLSIMGTLVPLTGLTVNKAELISAGRIPLAFSIRPNNEFLDDERSLSEYSLDDDQTNRQSIVAGSYPEEQSSKKQQLQLMQTYRNKAFQKKIRDCQFDDSNIPLLHFLLEDTERRKGYSLLHAKFYDAIQRDLLEELGVETTTSRTWKDRWLPKQSAASKELLPYKNTFETKKAHLYLHIYQLLRMELFNRETQPQQSDLPLLTDKQVDRLTRPGNYLGQMECFAYLIKSRTRSLLTGNRTANQLLTLEKVKLAALLLRNTVQLIGQEQQVHQMIKLYCEIKIESDEKPPNEEWEKQKKQKFILAMVLLYVQQELEPLNSKLGQIINGILSSIVDLSSEENHEVDIHHETHCFTYNCQSKLLLLSGQESPYQLTSDMHVNSPHTTESMHKSTSTKNTVFDFFDRHIKVTDYDQELLLR